MEIIQGKSSNKKIVVAQEIAFAKVLAGNNKTLRNRAVKKLKKWLTIRGNGKWEFTEDEFMRIWTGLFYCMWMSDKFLVQEELAECISKLIHCFKKNSHNALLFIKCFNKRILMDWEGLDQYRIDKFNMLVRRFLRQTFVYCREKNWDESFLNKLMGIYYNVVLHRDNSLGFVLHFISIYLEELAKISRGKLESKAVLTLIEPFVKLLARTRDARIQREVEDFFVYLMRQTDPGIEFEERFDAWKRQGYPGSGPHCLKKMSVSNGNHTSPEDEEEVVNDDEEDEEDEMNYDDQPLDPRAGSVHVLLPQIRFNVDDIIELFKKHKNSKQSFVKGRRILKSLMQKYEALKRGKFPVKIKKDPILMETKKKKKLSVKNAKGLLEFTQQLDKGSIKTKEFEDISKELFNQESDSENKDESNNDNEEVQTKITKKTLKKVKNPVKKSKKTSVVLRKKNEKLLKKTKKSIKGKRKEKSIEKILANDDVVLVPKKKRKTLNGVEPVAPENDTPVSETKRKILSNWQVQELDTSSPEYFQIKTQKVIRIEKKLEDSCCFKENEPEKETESNGSVTPQENFVPIFWEKAKAKAQGTKKSPKKVFVNPFANGQDESKTPGRRISFALDRNMAQENEQYLEEVKNSPRVPFDGTKKPVQSALKSGLAPSPVNPFYRFKKIKF